MSKVKTVKNAAAEGRERSVKCSASCDIRQMALAPVTPIHAAPGVTGSGPHGHGFVCPLFLRATWPAGCATVSYVRRRAYPVPGVLGRGTIETIR